MYQLIYMTVVLYRIYVSCFIRIKYKYAVQNVFKITFPVNIFVEETLNEAS